MTTRKIILFKVDSIIMVQETRDLTLTEIEKMKELVAQECECSVEDVEVEQINNVIELSEDVDSTDIGLVFWRSLSFEPIVGVMCQLDENEFIDLMLDYMQGKEIEGIDEKLNFFID